MAVDTASLEQIRTSRGLLRVFPVFAVYLRESEGLDFLFLASCRDTLDATLKLSTGFGSKRDPYPQYASSGTSAGRLRAYLRDFLQDPGSKEQASLQSNCIEDFGQDLPETVSADEAEYDRLRAALDPRTIFDASLWGEIAPPDRVLDLIDLFMFQSQETKPEFRFWREWYQGFLDGKPLPWELQRRVALIADEIWEAGPEAVAEEIEKIRAKFDLEQRIEALEAERDSLLAEKSRHSIGGNNPPEDKRIEAEVRETVTLIWAEIEELKAEVEKPSPVKATVAWIIEKLVKGLKALVALCGRLGEHALKVAVGTMVATGTVGFIKPELLEAVIEAAKRWLNTL